MPSIIDVGNVVGDLLGPIRKIVDEFKFSGEEKARAKLALYGAEIGLAGRMLEYEADMMQAKASVVLAEAQGDSWIQKTWRPITAMSFVFLILYNIIFQPMLQWFLNWVAPHVPSLPIIEIPGWVGASLALCLGGYVASRGAEKITATVVKGGGITFGKKRKKSDSD
jgi:hypothetical protein